MYPNSEQLRKFISDASDETLVEIVQNENSEYSDEAVEIAKIIIEQRGGLEQLTTVLNKIKEKRLAKKNIIFDINAVDDWDSFVRILLEFYAGSEPDLCFMGKIPRPLKVQFKQHQITSRSFWDFIFRVTIYQVSLTNHSIIANIMCEFQSQIKTKWWLQNGNTYLVSFNHIDKAWSIEPFENLNEKSILEILNKMVECKTITNFEKFEYEDDEYEVDEYCY